ncbi:MAG TPA: hypothetical protein DDW76_00065 [Cyanobacteria bacterium UBA11369]|nr:hypothetical protein [Cyanobacteria bacterium UBA8543]HAZ49329.1 hypothetical protein [Cyanobacteria bacterium UBA11371]HBE47240.1 hypothetical protein [Cyanobacteria bacterium UBA11369]
MVDPRNDLTKQARTGSITAIIQLLNEDLASIGVRARAVRDCDLLQLLCEAETVEQLEQSTLVERIRQILEFIGPRDIRRVKINSRLVREQQLLWLQEINRERENQLLWFEEIKLARRNPNFQNLMGLVAELRERQTGSIKQPLPKPSPSPIVRHRRQLRRGMMAGVVMSLSLLLVGWGFYKWFGPKQADSTPVSANGFIDASLQTSQADVPDDPFAAAVRMAEQASTDGRTAQTPAQWLEIATRWQKASDLMAQVPFEDKRYQTAQNRKVLYRKNSEAALQELARRRSQL